MTGSGEGGNGTAKQRICLSSINPTICPQLSFFFVVLFDSFEHNIVSVDLVLIRDFVLNVPNAWDALECERCRVRNAIIRIRYWYSRGFDNRYEFGACLFLLVLDGLECRFFLILVIHKF